MSLTINNLTIDKLSGPASFLLLKPKKDFINKLKNINSISPPIIIIFGDSHWSQENMCDPCNNDLNCFRIYDWKFLLEVDNLSKHFQVDWFSEYFYSSEKRKIILDMAQEDGYKYTKKFLHKTIPRYTSVKFKKESKDIGPMNKTIESIISCYIRELKDPSILEKGKKLCPTNYIHWNFSDVRNVLDIESNVLSYDTYFYESAMMFVLNEIIVAFDNYVHNDQRNIDGLLVLLHKIFDNYKKDDIYQIILALYNLMDKPISSFIDFYFNENNKLFTTNSAIYKQIKKLKPPFNNFEKWKESYGDLVYNLYNRSDSQFYQIFDDSISPFASSKKNSLNPEYIYDISMQKKYLLKFMDFILEDMFDTKSPDECEDFDNLFNSLSIDFYDDLFTIAISDIFTIFNDMYFMTRTLKSAPVVSIGYFGKFHQSTIKHFFVDLLKGYEVVEEIYNKKENLRCIEFTKSINLNEMISLLS